jgi:P2 family phage contractile tail tube protein
MATARKPQIITGANVFLNELHHLGVTSKFTPPKIKFITKDHKNGTGTRSSNTKILEKLTATIELSEYSKAVYASMAIYGEIIIRVKANIAQDGKDLAYNMLLKGFISELDDGDIEADKDVTRKIVLEVDSYTWMINDTEAVIIDLPNNICMFDGIDVWADRRVNLN